MNITNTELVGYLASALLIISFMLKNIRALRMVNSLGALFFVVYGFLLSISWPIIITNTFIIMVNLYRLKKSKTESEINF